MKIACITYSTKLGGLEKVFLQWHDILNDAGHEVKAFLPCNAKLLKSLEGANIYQNNALRNSSIWKNVFSFLKLKQQLRAFKPDVIIVHNARNAKIIRKAKNKKARLIGICHGGNPKNLIGYHHIVSINDQIAEQLIKLGQAKSKISIIPNCIKIAKKAKIKDFYKSDIEIAAIGRFRPEKGLEDFIKALAILKQNGFNFKASIAGDGELKSKLIKLAKTEQVDINFVGWTKDAKDFFTDKHIFVSSSISEAFGLTTLEAMASNLAIVATKTAGSVEILTNNKDSYLCEIAQPKDLAKKIALLLNNREKCKEFSKNGWDKVNKNYNLSKYRQKVLDLIETS